MSNSDCHCEFRRIASVNNRPATTVAATAQRQSHGDQRDPARHLDAKALVCQHRKPPIKGINISQGSNRRSLFLVKVPSGPDFQRILTQKILFGLGVVSDAPRRQLIRLRSYMPRGNPTILNSTQYHHSASTTTAPMLMDATYQRR